MNITVQEQPRAAPGELASVRVGIALLSFAHAHQHHWARAFAADPRVELVGFWDDDERRASAAETELGLRRYDDLDELLAEKRVTAAAICSETSRHRELTEACAIRGIHILCEKPVAPNLEEARAMRAAVRRSGVVYFQSSPQRLIPGNRRMIELVRGGAIGRVTHVRKRHGHHFALESLERDMPWIVDPAASGGGALLDEGVHETDALRELLGDPLSVFAAVAEPQRYRVETGGTAVFEFPGGVTAVLEAAWNWPAAGPTTEIFGEEGALIESLTDCASNSAGQFWPHLAVYRTSEGLWRDTGERFDFGEIHHLGPRAFVESLERGVEPVSTIDDGIAALAMVTGAYRSARLGRRVDFPLPEERGTESG